MGFWICPSQVYKKSGLLGSRTILAHCVHLTDEEVEVTAHKKIQIIGNIGAFPCFNVFSKVFHGDEVHDIVHTTGFMLLIWAKCSQHELNQGSQSLEKLQFGSDLPPFSLHTCSFPTVSHADGAINWEWDFPLSKLQLLSQVWRLQCPTASKGGR